MPKAFPGSFIRGFTVLFVLGAALADAEAGKPRTVTGEAVSADGTKIAYTVRGTRGPALVFVHGWTGDAGVWDAQVDAFSPRYRVVTLDLAGHGKSADTRKEWTIPRFGEDVLAVLKVLRLRHAVLVGHSMGGPVILETARMATGGEVAALVPVDTLHKLDRSMSPDQIQTFVGLLKKDFVAGCRDALAPHLFAPGTDPALKTKVLDKMTAASPEIAVPAMENLLKWDPRGWAGSLSCPVRAVNADLAPTDIEANRKFIKDYEVVVLKGRGHFPMMEAPEEFNRALGQILDRLFLKE
ncbi:MAG: alpha/beta hydrolase [Acidobacteria bacterium]|nr:alpha/beta hydrolase [Acidobacteriota bacterium]